MGTRQSRKGQAGVDNPAYIHGHTEGKFSPTYHSWASMIQRCTNQKRASWKHYGGKGVTVCTRWMTFTNFLTDMGERPRGLSLERKNVRGNYNKRNCKWATRVEQARNSVQVVWVQIGKRRKRLIEWCEELGVSINTVRDRVKFYGHTYESALLKNRKPKKAKR